MAKKLKRANAIAQKNVDSQGMCEGVCVCVRIKGVCVCRCRCVCWCDALVRKLATCTDIALVLLECLSEHACLSTHIRISFSGFLSPFPSLPSYTKS